MASAVLGGGHDDDAAADDVRSWHASAVEYRYRGQLHRPLLLLARRPPGPLVECAGLALRPAGTLLLSAADMSAVGAFHNWLFGGTVLGGGAADARPELDAPDSAYVVVPAVHDPTAAPTDRVAVDVDLARRIVRAATQPAVEPDDGAETGANRPPSAPQAWTSVRCFATDRQLLPELYIVAEPKQAGAPHHATTVNVVPLTSLLGSCIALYHAVGEPDGSAASPDTDQLLDPALASVPRIGISRRVHLLPGAWTLWQASLLLRPLLYQAERQWAIFACQAWLDAQLHVRVHPTQLRAVLATAMAERGVNDNYERLEFIGDAALKLCVSYALFASNPHADEGLMTEQREQMVSNQRLEQLADQLGLRQWISDRDQQHWNAPLWDNQTQQSYRVLGAERKCVADVFEALLAAILQEHGLRVVWRCLACLNFVSQHDSAGGEDAVTIDIDRDAGILRDCQQAVLRACGYQFRRLSFIGEALTPRAMSRPDIQHGYERLKWLGNAVLEFAVSCALYVRSPNESPEHMTQLRSSAANNDKLAQIAVNIGLPEFFRQRNGGPMSDRKLCDLLKAVVGAIFLDAGALSRRSLCDDGAMLAGALLAVSTLVLGNAAVFERADAAGTTTR